MNRTWTLRVGIALVRFGEEIKFSVCNKTNHWNTSQKGKVYFLLFSPSKIPLKNYQRRWLWCFEPQSVFVPLAFSINHPTRAIQINYVGLKRRVSSWTSATTNFVINLNREDKEFAVSFVSKMFRYSTQFRHILASRQLQLLNIFLSGWFSDGKVYSWDRLSFSMFAKRAHNWLLVPFANFQRVGKRFGFSSKWFCFCYPSSFS